MKPPIRKKTTTSTDCACCAGKQKSTKKRASTGKPPVNPKKQKGANILPLEVDFEDETENCLEEPEPIIPKPTRTVVTAPSSPSTSTTCSSQADTQIPPEVVDGPSGVLSDASSDSDQEGEDMPMPLPTLQHAVAQHSNSLITGTAEGLRCKLGSPAPKQNPFVYPRNIEVETRSVDITTSFRCGDYGGFVNGTFCDTLDVTIVTKFKMTVDNFLAAAKVLHNFRQCKHFVRVLAVVTKPGPLMMILGETVHNTLQQHLRIDGGKTITFKSLTEIAAEIAEGMAFLEKKNVVHHNLKAENVFVCELYQPKIMHPTLSKMLKYRSSDEHLEDENDWQWTAPEDVDDEILYIQLSTKSDVWSFGVLLYELITFGKEPYAGFTEENTLHRLRKGFRLSKPKDGPLPCPVAFYATILKCWHRLPECRPTFHFLADFLHDFECATESEIGLNDANKLGLYMLGPLQQETAKLDSHTYVNVKRLTKTETQLNLQTSEPQESVSTTSRNLQKEETVEQSAQSKNNGKLQITGGFSVKALYNYKADTGRAISIYVDDIITDVDPGHEEWWRGTAPSGSRGYFPSSYVEVFENAYSDVIKNN